MLFMYFARRIIYFQQEIPSKMARELVVGLWFKYFVFYAIPISTIRDLNFELRDKIEGHNKYPIS